MSVEEMQEIQRIRDYVSRQGDCDPDEVTLLPDDSGSHINIPLFKVTVKEFNDEWDIVEPPEFWYVADYYGMNLYRSDEYKSPDIVRSIHAGLMLRLGTINNADT